MKNLCKAKSEDGVLQVPCVCIREKTFLFLIELSSKFTLINNKMKILITDRI